MPIIYKITNSINNKIYVGKTKVDPKLRWTQHQNSINHRISYRKPLILAMKKYGVNNFSFEILENVLEKVGGIPILTGKNGCHKLNNI